MKNFIEFVKFDFNSVRGTLDTYAKQPVPLGLVVLWYMCLLPIGIIWTCIAIVESKIALHKYNKNLKEEA